MTKPIEKSQISLRVNNGADTPPTYHNLAWGKEGTTQDGKTFEFTTLDLRAIGNLLGINLEEKIGNRYADITIRPPYKAKEGGNAEKVTERREADNDQTIPF
jgi:hypothetical protein